MDREFRVGDFVTVQGRSESSDGRLGRIERIDEGEYQVRMLQAHRRWAAHTTAQRREWLRLDMSRSCETVSGSKAQSCHVLTWLRWGWVRMDTLRLFFPTLKLCTK